MSINLSSGFVWQYLGLTSELCQTLCCMQEPSIYHSRERVRRFHSGKRVSIDQSIEKAMKTKISDTENVKHNMKEVRESKNVQRSQGFQERCIKLAKYAKKTSIFGCARQWHWDAAGNTVFA